MPFSYPTAPENVSLDENYIRKLVRVVNQIMRGKTNNTGEVTLDTTTTATVVADINVGAESFISFMPTTANAALEVSSGSMYVSTVGDQTFTVTHDSNTTADRTFIYTVVG